jgi:hypothetical protein
LVKEHTHQHQWTLRIRTVKTLMNNEQWVPITIWSNGL